MASHAISGQQWPDGTNVSLYYAEALPVGAAAPLGAAVSSAVVSAGIVEFDDLTSNRSYLAWASGIGVRFTARTTLPADLRDAASSDRARVDALYEREADPDLGGGNAASVTVEPFGSVEATNVQDALEEIVNEVSGGSASDASTGTKGITRLSAAPASPSAPIAVGTNDARVTADQAAGTASIRTLSGSGSATSAAKSDHTHSGVYDPAGSAASAVAAHEADATNAHAASAIGFSATGTIAATTVQAAVAEVATDAAAALAAHEGDTTAAHAASAVSFTPTGTISATNVQAALAEVASEGGGGGGGTQALVIESDEAAPDPSSYPEGTLLIRLPAGV